MYLISAEEASRICEDQIARHKGVTRECIETVWFELVTNILDRLEIWHERELRLRLAGEILSAWRDVVTPSFTRSPQTYLEKELTPLRAFFVDLDNIAQRVALSINYLPCDGDTDRSAKSDLIRRIRAGLHSASDRLRQVTESGAVTITQDGFKQLARYCVALLTIVLGQQIGDLFWDDYGACMQHLDRYLIMGQMTVVRPN